MYVVSVYRPEVADDFGNFTHGTDPFSGIEILGIVDTERQADALVDHVIESLRPRPWCSWKFHIEPTPHVNA